jgi:hypothetical protein
MTSFKIYLMRKPQVFGTLNIFAVESIRFGEMYVTFVLRRRAALNRYLRFDSNKTGRL